KLVGIGGAGNRILEHLVQGGTTMVTDWIAIDTDHAAINRSHANIKLCFEPSQRVDSRDRLACPAAYEYVPSDHGRAAIGHTLTGADAVCILAGLGGRTGTHL